MEKRKIIIDCDPGVDDTIEILVALGSVELDVLGLTTVGGNVSAEQTRANAAGVLALANMSRIPVHAGKAAGLSGEMDKAAAAKGSLVHGKSGVHGLRLPKIDQKLQEKDGVSFIIDTVREAPEGAITLVASGPLTNVAAAFNRAPHIVDRLQEIVVMGGAFGDPGGNVKPYAEFNINGDPVAARIVFEKANRIVVVPLDVTHQTLYDRPIRNMIRAIGGDFGKNIGNMLDACAENYPGFNGDAAPLHDVHTVTYLLRPEMYNVAHGRVNVHDAGAFSGKTEFLPSDNGNAVLTQTVDSVEFFHLVANRLETLASALPSSRKASPRNVPESP